MSHLIQSSAFFVDLFYKVTYTCVCVCVCISIGFWFMQGVEAEKVDADENCEGIGKEECLMRRTLAAHVDYIYTQNHKPWSWIVILVQS